MSLQPEASNLRPLGLTRMLSVPDRRLDATPLLDAVLIIVMFLVLGSRFVLPPGVSIALPTSPEPNLRGLPTVDVLTIKSEEFIIYQETKFTLNTLQKAIEAGTVEAPPEGALLLVRADQSVDMQDFISISQLAREAGYAGMQLAAREPIGDAADLFTPEEVPAQLFP